MDVSKTILSLLMTGLVIGCNLRQEMDQKRQQAIYQSRIGLLKTYRIELMKEAERAESFVTTAEVHQVLRTPEQKEEQVANLKLYQKRIGHQIDSLDVLIKRYEDSLRLASD